MNATLFIKADFIKKMLLFCSKDAARWAIENCMSIKKYGDGFVEFAATDGMKLVVIRRKLEKDEFIDDGQYVVSINNLPLKGKYLQYILTIDNNESAFNDSINVFRFPLKMTDYVNYNNVLMPLLDSPFAEHFVMFKPENTKAGLGIMGNDIYHIPRTRDDHSFLWQKVENGEDIYVVMCPIRG